jgi:hypothetical protein
MSPAGSSVLPAPDPSVRVSEGGAAGPPLQPSARLSVPAAAQAPRPRRRRELRGPLVIPWRLGAGDGDASAMREDGDVGARGRGGNGERV